MGQDIIMGKGSLIKTCKGQFFDSGGAKGNYAGQEKSSVTICSDGQSSLTHISLSFNGLELSKGDKLCFYDGPNTQSKLIVCNDQLPKIFIIQATADNPSGCITVAFESFNTQSAAGWSASVQCVPSCQRIEAEIAQTTPGAIPIDTGWVDICPLGTVTFDGNALFPQNGIKYNQTLANSVFEWNFGDGTSQTGKKVSHVFTKSGGFVASLTVKDQLGCKSTNYVRKKIRVATAPIFSASMPTNNFCIGDTIRLKANINSINSLANLNVIPKALAFSPSGIRSDSLALPDGDGTSYKTSIRFSDFPAGATLTNIADLVQIGVNMEHSWLRDLLISIECPNGQSAILHNYLGRIGNKVTIGQPVETDTITPKSGIGYDYQWKYNALNDPWLQWANNNPSKGALPSGDYRPYESFTKLIGCPLNGDWSIKVQDLWSRDNGFIFNWNIAFNPKLLTNKETFVAKIVDSKWLDNNTTIFTSRDSLVAVAKAAGVQSYTFRVNDEFGCTHDTTLTINVLPPTNPNCKTCANVKNKAAEYTICKGSQLNLDASIQNSTNVSIPFASTPNYRFGYSNHPPSIPYISEITISDLLPLSITDALQSIQSVCLDIETDYAADLQLFLEAPNGKILELSTNNGGSGQNYTQTCFTPKAAKSVKSGTAPFKGDFQPEGNWQNLDNSPTNGKWKLKVSDAFGAGIFGILKSWSITINIENKYQYQWSPPVDISCINCPNPTVSPKLSTPYTVKVTDAYGCIFVDTIKVKTVDKLPAPQLRIDPANVPGQVVVSWQSIAGVIDYEVNINNTGWMPSNGPLSHTLVDQLAGRIIDIQVRAKNSPCGAEVATIQTKYDYCPLQLAIDSLQLPRCFNTNEATLQLSTKASFGAVTYVLNGIESSTGLFKNLFAGQYQAIVKDKFACADTIELLIPKIDSIRLSFQVDSIRCFGQKGAIFAFPGGGKGNLTIEWNTTPPTSSTAIANLSAGVYTLTAKDKEGCEEKQSIVLTEPTRINLAPVAKPVSCFGNTDGEATVKVTGGKPNYTFYWDNKATDSTLTNLSAGTYRVSIVDGNYCLDSSSVVVPQPNKLVSDIKASLITCKGGNSGTAEAVPMGGTSPYQFIWNDSKSQVVAKATTLAAGYYKVTITDKNNCTFDTAVVVNENAGMELSCTQNPSSCFYRNDGSANVSIMNGIGPFSYSWNDPKVQNTATANNLLAGEYIVTVTDGNGCKKVAVVEVKSPDTIGLEIKARNLSCGGGNDGKAEAIITGGIAPFTFQWDDVLQQQSAAAIGLSPGNYQVTATDKNGCLATKKTTILPPLAILVDSIVKKSPKCSGTNDGSIQLFVSGGAGNFKYSWDDSFSQFQNPATNLKGGNYKVTITDDANCLLIQSMNLPSPDPLTATSFVTPVKCRSGMNGSIDLTINGGSAPYTTLWTSGKTTEDLYNLISGNYTVTITDRQNCQILHSANVMEPSKSISAVLDQYWVPCNGGNAKCRAVASGGSGKYYFKWSNGETGDSALLLRPGMNSLTITDASECTFVDSIVVKEWDPIVASFLKQDPSCYASNNGQIGVSSISGGSANGVPSSYQYLWNTNPIGNKALISSLVEGVYRVTISDPQGCQTTEQIALKAPPKMQFTLGTVPTRCYDSPDGSGTILSVVGGSPDYTYIWDKNANNQVTETAINLKYGTYFVTVQDAMGCKKDTFLQVGRPSKIELERFETKSGLCDGDTLGQATAFAKGGTTPYQFLWSNGKTTSTATGLKSGFITVTITDFFNCSVIATGQLKSLATLEAKLSVNPVTCHDGTDGGISIEPSNGTQPYKSSLDGFTFSPKFKYIGLKPGKYAVFLKDANGCAWVGDTELTNPTAMKLDAGPDIELNYGDSVQLRAVPTNHHGKVSYEWFQPYKSTLSCLNCDRPWAKTLYDIVYQVIATDSTGCEAESDVRIKIIRKAGVDVPTGFTPNGDGNNDLLLVHGVANTKVLSFRIYDAWGEQLFEDNDFLVNDVTRGWDGDFRSKAAPSGVYVWYLTVENKDGTRKAYKGNTTLIR